MTDALLAADALGHVRALRQLSREQLEVLTHYVIVHTLPTGAEFQPPDAGVAMMLSGAAQLHVGADGGALVGIEESPLLVMTAGATLGVGALWSQPHAVVLVASESSQVAWLSRTAFEQLAQTEPALAAHVLQGALGESDNRAGRWTRAARGTVVVRIGDESRVVPFGSPVAQVLPRFVDDLAVVAALVNDSAVSLATPLVANCSVRPLTTHSWEGQRVQRNSLALLALEAARRVDPTLDVKAGPSVGFGQRILVERSPEPGVASAAALRIGGQELVAFGARLEAEMRALMRQPLHLSQDLWPIDEASSYFLSHRYRDAEQLLRTWRESAVPVVSYGEVFAIDMGPLVTRNEALGDFYIICDADFLLLVYGKKSRASTRPTESIPAVALSDVGETATPVERRTRSYLLGQARSSGITSQGESFEEQAWLRALGVTSIGSFNRACIESSVPEMIRVSEGFHEKRISVIADEIAERKGDVDIVTIAGPSSSGKSTFIRRLIVQLKVNGITPVGLGLDDYYVDRAQTPLDETGDYDFEALEALHLPLLHEHIVQLLAGKPVRTPRYDFIRGKSELGAGRAVQLRQSEVLVIEGIHGLNPDLLGAIPQPRVFRILVCPLMQLSFDHASRVHASDVRLLRRIVRDRHSRGLNAAQTIARWPKVRAGERRYIYPHQTRADAVFDSSLIYELSVLRVYAERYLLEVPRQGPAYATALRLMHFLDRFVSIYPQHVPATSILREFIGGSGFDD